jgi:hypothetical protein
VKPESSAKFLSIVYVIESWKFQNGSTRKMHLKVFLTTLLPVDIVKMLPIKPGKTVPPIR